MRSYHDVIGDGGSRVLEQVQERRARIDAALADVEHIVAIGSGKGGVGKSTLTFQLAQALQRDDRKVAVLDADLNGPCQARMAGVAMAPLVPDGERLAMPRTPDGIGVVSVGSLVPESDDVQFETVSEGDSHTWRATREFSFLGQLVGSVAWGRLDFLFVDLPPGAERTFQYAEFLGKQTDFVLVTIPSEVARGVVSRSVAALSKTPNRILGYVENMKGYVCPGCRELKPLFPQARGPAPDLELLGSVPFDPMLAAICDRGEPAGLAGDSPSMKSLAAVARRVVELVEEAR